MTSPIRNDPRTIFGWAMYDWANSAYITAGSLVFAILFSDVIYPPDGVTIGGVTIEAEAFFAIVIGVGALLLFLAMPVLGAVADYTNSKKRLLRFFAYTGAAFAVLTALPGEGDLILAMVLALLAQIGFAASNVMYDAFLPEITTPDTVDRVSARGFAFGYAGGGLHLILSVALLFSADQLGLAEETAERIVIASAGIWWAGFATFAFSRLRDPGGSRAGWRAAASGSAATPGSDSGAPGRPPATWWPTAARPLPARLSLLQRRGGDGDPNHPGVRHRDTRAQRRTDRWGLRRDPARRLRRRSGVRLAGRSARHQAGDHGVDRGVDPGRHRRLPPPRRTGDRFLFIGALAGLVLGGVQALSRSLYASMIPEDSSAEFFGFYSVFSKFSAIFGPLIFAAVGIATGSSRLAILFLVSFFILGAILLSKVDVEAGRSAAERQEPLKA